MFCGIGTTSGRRNCMQGQKIPKQNGQNWRAFRIQAKDLHYIRVRWSGSGKTDYGYLTPQKNYEI